MRTPAKWPYALLLAATIAAFAQIPLPSLFSAQIDKARALLNNSLATRETEIAKPEVIAATFVVNTTADTQDALAGDAICADLTGACSLRAAITEANALPGADIITLPAGTYTITLPTTDDDINVGGDFDITSPITINGAGSGTTIIQANVLPDTATERVIHCTTAATAVVINDVTIRHGNSATNISGSGIRLETATTNLTLNRVIVTKNRSAGSGGGISIVTAGIFLNINDSTISTNSAGSFVAGSGGRGAGIDVAATATVNITNTIVTGNAINSSVSNTLGAGVNISPNAVGATVTITGSTISNNSSISTAPDGFGIGAGVYNGESTLIITNSSVTGNTASGAHAGVRTRSGTGGPATTTITNSTISNNIIITSEIEGGAGVANFTVGTFDAITTITGSTISGNSVSVGEGVGGGIENVSTSTGAATVTLTNSTVSGNSASSGGGIFNEGDAATINLDYSTVASNTATGNGGGLYQEFTKAGGATNLKNSIVADNTTGESPDSFGTDIFGTITSQDYNHVESTDGGTFVALANDVTGSDPQLGPLANNGGPTATHLPGGASPVLDTIPTGTGGCGTTITVDQRGAGFPRPSGTGCDKGSVEGGCPPGWSSGANFPAVAVARAVGIHFPANGRFYIMGGRSADLVGTEFTHPFEYNPAPNTWITKAATYPDINVNNMACGVLTVGGTSQIYCVSGSTVGGNTAATRVFSYDPITDTITTLMAADNWPGSPGGTILPGGFAVAGNKLYIIGGFEIDVGSTAQTWQFDPTAVEGSRWLQRSDYPVARSYVPSATIDGLIYTGGGSSIAPVVDTADSFKYDPALDTWTPIADMPRATGETRAVVVNHEMWVLGGGRTAPNPSNEVDIYNPGSNTWRLGPPFVTARRNFPADSDGSRVWLAGGYDSDVTPLNTMEVYGPDVCPIPTPTPTPGGTPTPTPGGTPTPTPAATPTPASQAINLSTRLRVQSGDNVGIGGFIVTGSAPKHVLLRAIGPSLTGFGVPDALADPVMELNGPTGFVTIIDDNWRDDSAQAALIKASGIPPTNDLESAIDATLNPGAYTAIVRGKNDTSGVALIEVYDLSQAVPAKLANISTRAFVDTGDNLVIAGFILGGNSGNTSVILRGIGPSLTQFGVPNALADPILELRDNNGALIIANNNWQDDPVQAAALTAAGLAPTNHLEAGIAATLSPGLYTALLAGLDNGAGVGLVEVYDLGGTP